MIAAARTRNASSAGREGIVVNALAACLGACSTAYRPVRRALPPAPAESCRPAARCIRTDLDRADICPATGAVLSRQTHYDATLMRALLDL